MLSLLFALVGLAADVGIAAAATPGINATPNRQFGSGQKVMVDGFGFDPMATVKVWVDQDEDGVPAPGETSLSVHTDSSGNFPGSAIKVFGSPGVHSIRAKGPGSIVASTKVNIRTCWIQDMGCTINGNLWICIVGNAPSELISDCKELDANYSDPATHPNGYDLRNVGPRFVGAGVLAAAAVSVNPVPFSACPAMVNAIAIASNAPYNNVVPDQSYFFAPTHGLLTIACGNGFLPPFDLGLYTTAATAEALLPGHHGLPDAAFDDAGAIGAIVGALLAAAPVAEATVPGSGIASLFAAQQAFADAAVAGAIACGFVNYYCNGSDITSNVMGNPVLQTQRVPFNPTSDPTRWGDIIGWAQVTCTSLVPGTCESATTLPMPGTAGPNNAFRPEQCATGRVNGLSIGFDGDLSFDVNDNLVDPETRPGPGITPLVNYQNFQPGFGGAEAPGGIDIEVPLADRGIFLARGLANLRVGMQVRVCGRWVTDMNQGWNELHPMTSLTVLPPLPPTPPLLSPTITGTLGANGWYAGVVGVSWSLVNPGSTITSRSGCDPTTIDVDTTANGTTLTCSATSAGGPSTRSVTIFRDGSKPTISAVTTTPPNLAGWNNTDVTVDIMCSDDLSGVPTVVVTMIDFGFVKYPLVRPQCLDQTLSTEGFAVSSTAETAVDNAGNVSDPSNVVTVNIDKTSPTVSVTGVTDGGEYLVGLVPDVACETIDSLSGVATFASLEVTTTGADRIGSFTATCTGATDIAFNATEPVSVTYDVQYRFGDRCLAGCVEPTPRD